MVRSTDQEMIVIETIVYHSSQEEGVHHTAQGRMGKHKCRSGGRGHEGKMWAGAFTMVSTGRNRQGRVSRLGIG